MEKVIDIGNDESAYKNKITYMSFILAILVVIRHSVNIDVYNLKYGYLYFVESFCSSLSELAVPTFFVLSGYLFFVIFRYSKLLSKWKSRFFSILIPYLIWNVVAYLFYQLIACFPFVRNSMNQSLEEFSIKLLFLNAIFGYHNITWFLQNLMIYIVVTPLLFFLIKKKITIIFALPIVYWLGTIEGYYCYYWLYYIIGAYLGIHYSSVIKERTYSKLCMGLSAIALVILSILDIYIDIFEFRVCTIISIACVWIMLDFLRINNAPKWWMRISFFIYCTHSIALESVEKAILILLGNNKIGACIDFCLAPFITSFFIFLAAWILRHFPRLWKVVNGNRT